jgi:predicted lipoprotein with Yx(FWY)xxD motif
MVTMQRPTRGWSGLLIGCALAAGLVPLTLAAPAGAHTSPSHTLKLSTAKVAGIGTVLTTSSGRTLYRFTHDHGGKPSCTGACAQVWPPLLVPKGDHLAVPHGVKGLRAVHIGHGHLQVEFHGAPLYRFSGDAHKGQAKGQDVEGSWFAVLKSGASSATKSAAPVVGGTTTTTAGTPTTSTAVPATSTTAPPSTSTMPVTSTTQPLPTATPSTTPTTTTTTTRPPTPTTTTTPVGGYGY